MSVHAFINALALEVQAPNVRERTVPGVDMFSAERVVT